MPYKINKKSCKQSDGDSGSYVLSYTDKKGKKHNNCHTSKKKAQGQIAAIEGPREVDEGDSMSCESPMEGDEKAEETLEETDDMVFGGGGAEADQEDDELEEALLRQWVREKFLYEQSEKRPPSWAKIARGVLADINQGPIQYEMQASEKRRSSVRLLVPGLDPEKTKDVSAELEKHGEDIVSALTAAGYVDRSGGRPAKVRSSVSGKYPSLALQKPDGTNFYVVLNPGFRLTGGGGNAGPGETELFEINDESPVFQKFAQEDGMTFDFDGFQIENVTAVSKPASIKGGGGEAKSDIDLQTKNGLIRLSLKEPRFPTYEGLSDARLNNYPGFKEISDCAKQQLAVHLLEAGTVPTVIEQTSELIIIELERTGEPAFELPEEQQIQAVYGTKATGGPVDYVVSVPSVAEWSIPDANTPVVNWTGYKFVAKNPASSFPGELPLFPEGATPVILFRTANDGRAATAVLEGSGGKEIRVKITNTRAAVIPLEQRRAAEVLGPADACPPPAVVDGLFDQISTMPELVGESALRSYIREKLLLEDLTRADRTEIARIFKKELEKSSAAKKIIRKEVEAYDKKTLPALVDKAFKKNFDKELKKALGVSFFGTPGKINKFVVDEIHDEVEKILGDKATREMVVQICKDVIIKLYRELSFTYKPVIQRLKV